jgi:uncharacterized protein YcfJ
MEVRMNTEINTVTISIAQLTFGDPMAFKNSTDNESRIQNRDDNDPEQGPKPQKGDNNLFIGTVIGIVIGCTAGAILGNKLSGTGGLFLGIVTGAVIGGLCGVYAGSYLKKRNMKENEEKTRA